MVYKYPKCECDDVILPTEKCAKCDDFIIGDDNEKIVLMALGGKYDKNKKAARRL